MSELAQKMSEKQLQAAVLECAGYYGWFTYHTFDSRRSVKGFPDLTLIKDRVVFVELKSEKGKLTFEQNLWARQIGLAGVDWYVWRPADWLDGTIERILKGER